MGTGIKRVQAVIVVSMLTILGFVGVQPAMATQTEPGPGVESPEPSSPETPTTPAEPPVVLPTFEPLPPLIPLDPETPPVPVQPPVAPAPVNPPAAEPVAPPVVPADPSQERPVVVTPVEPGVQAYIPEQELPIETEAPAAVESTPSPTPVVTKTAAIPVASADIAGPLKVALAPVAENNPIVQGITVLVLILLGVAYFRALRSKRALKPRLNGK